LGGEKIDIIEYSKKAEKFVANALSPAKVLDVKIMPQNKALCLVPEDQLSLAIGKDGQNVRLAAKLTGWKIDVRGPGKEEELSSTEHGLDEKKGKEKEEVSPRKEEKEDKKSSPASVPESEEKKETKNKKKSTKKSSSKAAEEKPKKEQE
jgi:N utilization substance protein A